MRFTLPNFIDETILYLLHHYDCGKYNEETARYFLRVNLDLLTGLAYITHIEAQDHTEYFIKQIEKMRKYKKSHINPKKS